MRDVAMLLLIVIFFVLAIGYGRLCQRLLTGPTELDSDTC